MHMIAHVKHWEMHSKGGYNIEKAIASQTMGSVWLCCYVGRCDCGVVLE